MAQQSYAFDLPQWRTPHKLNTLIVGLLIGSLAWIGCYFWLGQRLWRNGLMLSDRLNQLLVLTSIVLGVAIVAGWTMLWPQVRARWQARSGKSEWPALSLKQIQALSPSEFEAYTAYRLFKRQGYRVLNTPDVKDGGIDVLVTDAFGRLAVVQCKAVQQHGWSRHRARPVRHNDRRRRGSRPIWSPPAASATLPGIGCKINPSA